MTTAGNWTAPNGLRLLLATAALPNLSEAAVKVALTTSTSVLTAATYSAISDEVTSGNGYTTGGVTGLVLSGETTGTSALVSVENGSSIYTVPVYLSGNAVWTVPASDTLSALYAVVYLATGGDIIAYSNLASTGTTPISVSGGSSGETLTLSNSAAVLILQ